ncbi:MAG: hypothetical protein CL927_11940 [Deltaproteobacteria bacterium]|nr:hypothetical protein [Deltaproteobacteria bacterium]HCH61618.1 hypothetical protein [Deltaproteobacteria bacterium]
MMPSLFFLWAAGLSSAADAAETMVLVPVFQSSDASTDDDALAIRRAVAQAIDGLDSVETVELTTVPAVGDLPAVDYAESCPPGEYVGCAFVLGEAGGVSLAVAGSVAPVDDGRLLVEVHVMDVPQSVDLISFAGEYDPLVQGEEFAFTVASVVAAAARGEVKAGGDIRAVAPVLDGDRAEKQAAGRQLDQLSQEIGGSGDVGDANVGEFIQEKYTTGDLARDMETDGAKPWDRVGMSAQEYLRYKNSKMNLYEWRSRQLGRKGQVLLRGVAGYGKAPSSGSYYGRYGVSTPDFEVEETYAWHSMVDGAAGRAALELGYGVIPELEVGLHVGWMGGRYTEDIARVLQDQQNFPREPKESANSNLYFGGQVLFAPFPVLPVRPVAGASFTRMRGRSIASFTNLSESESRLPEFEAPTSLFFGILPGVEARLGQRVDLFLHVPLNFAIGGNPGDEQRWGAGVLSDEDTAASADPLGSVYAGVQAGVQVRFLGAKLERDNTFDDPEEP